MAKRGAAERKRKQLVEAQRVQRQLAQPVTSAQATQAEQAKAPRREELSRLDALELAGLLKPASVPPLPPWRTPEAVPEHLPRWTQEVWTLKPKGPPKEQNMLQAKAKVMPQKVEKTGGPPIPTTLQLRMRMWTMEDRSGATPPGAL